jgi:Ca-activated chloride channel homolog
MNFEYPWFTLFLLLAVPGLLLWFHSAGRQRERMRKFSEDPFLPKLFVGRDPVLRRWHFILFFSALILLLAAANGPQIGGGKEKVKTTGIDIVIALDVSNSMLATDIQPSRIDRARLGLQQLISTMGSDRLGLVVFAGQAYTNLPLTDDHPAAEMVVESVHPDMISVQGTAIGAAIDQAVAAFSIDDKDRGKAIIIISDGENHEDNAVEAAKSAADKGILVCTIGIGSASGSKIPEYTADRRFIGNKRDENGNEVVSRLNEGLLRQIAQMGQGSYVHSNSADLGLGQVYASLQKLSKSTKETWRYTSFYQLAPWLIGLAIILLIVESFLPKGRKKERAS